jgi:phosphoserine phosphatase RsbU/P
LEQSIEPGRFVTFFLASLDPATLRLDYVNAGHPAPMLLRATGGTERLEVGGLILGIDAAAIFQSGSVTLAPGDLLALFTDGVTEAQGAGEELFGDERIEATLRLNRERRSEEVLNALIAAVKEYEGERGPSDDLTAIVVKVEVGA